MDYGLKGKIALVCGASAGMGRAVADALAREGADLFLVARRAEVLGASCDELRRAHGVKVLFAAGDLSNNDHVSRILEEHHQAFGRADILVTNAGGPPPGDFDTVSNEDMLRRGWELTFMSSVRMIRGVLTGMRERKWGRIVAITSVSVLEPIPGLALSNAYRPGLTGLLKTIATEVAADGVTVNSVCPGYTATERLEELVVATAGREGKSREQVASEWALCIPAQRLGRPEEVAAAVAFLSSEAASYITGVALPVDGGRLKGLFV
jgi:3-oxoacyl-[acyl-carrier protein] reductase